MASPPARRASRDVFDPLRDTEDDDPFQQISLMSPSALSPPVRPPTTPLTASGSSDHNNNLLSTFDPYRPQLPSPSNVYTPFKNSLLDDDSFISDVDDLESHAAVELLEMEEEEEQSPIASSSYPSPYDPIQTSSGLLLTHRRTPARPKQQPNDDNVAGVKRALYKMETEHDAYRATSGGTPFYSNSRGMSFLQQSRRLLSLVRLWVILSGFVLFMGTLVVVHHVRSESNEEQNATTTVSEIRLVALEPHQYPMIQQEQEAHEPDQIVLLPLPLSQQHEDMTSQQHHRHLAEVSPRSDTEGATHHRSLTELWSDFESWMSLHGKEYHSHEETQHRFGVWVENHHRTRAKNERHGPCKLTSQPVFGSNHLQDLTHEEFRDQYLTGYTGPKADEPGAKPLQVLGPHVSATRHAEVHRRIQEAWEAPARRASESGCSWYDVSCILRYVFNNYIYGAGGTMEPAYDADSYPEAVDWRDIGAVTAVRSQGNCGACWAITAVATVESAVFLATGQLYNLAETEVIVCEEDCQMCSGGWPQNAFDYVMDNGGLPQSSDMYYNGEMLLLYTEALEGTSDQLNESSVQSYRQEVCPAGSGSGDDSTGYARYGGELEGYGYATNKCVCYTDGSGCDCDEQNEGLAVRNLATYGPAVVCLDASTWQDYAGGIITPDSGCSAGFMDVNHCVQAVGYAFVSDDNDDDDKQGGSGSQDSHDSGSGSGSQDSAREGYWIVKNQWSSYWGMNGYAYVSMGDNTCGILNDMIQAYA